MFPNTYNVTRLLLAKLSQVARVLDFSSINWFELVQVLWTKFKAGATNRWKCWSEAFLKRKRNRLNEQGFLPNKRNPKPNKLNNQPFVEQVQTKLVFELNEGAISANEAEKTWTNRVFLNKSFHSETMTKFGGLVANKTLFDERFKIWPVSMTCSLNKTYQGGKQKFHCEIWPNEHSLHLENVERAMILCWCCQNWLLAGFRKIESTRLVYGKPPLEITISSPVKFSIR